MIWAMPQIWKGSDCFIFGGGSSILKDFNVPESLINQVLVRSSSPEVYSEYLKPLHSKHVIGINAAYLIGDWFDFIFFGDRRFFLENEKKLQSLGKPIVTCHHSFAVHSWVKYLGKGKPSGIETHSDKISWNENSGAAAISMAFNSGVKRIILLGFDMDLDEKQNTHWHSHYKKIGKKPTNPKITFARHLRSFGNIYQDSIELGIEVINTSMNSKIRELKKVPLKEFL